ncbi:hypothetical protein LSM04_002162 [Trypanosoma melophagium]|uniref:uncharacterized protein n=1 Tax=Trypanosoma melophagium TaxID=715481 RepID=UPI00351A0345|nr:hypothetical protein LSM04_002162 [Trypanosoma melophagium]
MKVDLTKQDAMSPSKERYSSFSPDPLPSRCLQMEDVCMKPENLGEALCGVIKEPLINKKKNETEYNNNADGTLSNIETYHMHELHMGLESIRAKIEAQFEEEVQRRLSSAEITLSLQNRYRSLNTSPVISHALRRLEGDEAIKRISIETSAISERRLLLLEWQLPQCLICGLPVSASSLAVQDPVNGSKTHFVCYAELRQQLYTEPYDNESIVSSNMRDGRSLSMEIPG